MYIIHVVIHVPCKDKTHIDLEGEPSLNDRYHKKNINWGHYGQLCFKVLHDGVLT